MTDFRLFGSEIIALEQWQVREQAGLTGRNRDTRPRQTARHRRTPGDQMDSTSVTTSLRSTTSATSARDSARHFLEGLVPALASKATDTVIPVVSELGTNALRHGSNTCTLDLTTYHDTIEAAARDPSPPARPHPYPQPEQQHRRLRLVAGAEARKLDRLGAAGRSRALLRRLVPHLGPEVLTPASWHEKSWHLDELVGGGYAALATPGTTDGYFPMPSQPVGALHWAGTETASEHAGYIEGAIESGERAASEVIRSLPHTAQ
ncbi:FAD-dependent oxidoreductase [Streptomyces sp. LMG1-1-1.1]|uniref:FAD-dependent oxidoreductase n=1 Tax=Streptomyces sp. LMG1-1-1.1 TaxID=3135245 RepID=UPI003467E433